MALQDRMVIVALRYIWQHRGELVGVFIATLLTWVFAVIVRRLFFHPLARHPGPVLGRITDWYNVYYVWTGDRHINFVRLHERYGPIVRFAPNGISFNTVEGLQKTYGSSANTQKSRRYYGVFSKVFSGNSSLTTTDAQRHLRKKKAVSTALGDANIKKMEELILRNLRTFLDRMGEQWNKSGGESPTSGPGTWSMAKNMSLWSQYLSFDLMNDICFSGNLDVLKSGVHRPIVEILSRGSDALFIAGHVPIIFRLKLGQLFFPTLHNDLKTYKKFAHDMSDARLAKEVDPDKSDVYSFLIKANADTIAEGQGALFSPEDLVGESSLLITGGSDTTAAAISATLFYLCHNPDVMRKAQQEIRSVFSEIEQIRSGPQLNSCRYLRACIDEAMRMSPPTPGLLPREVLRGGTTIHNQFFPEGADLGVSHYAIHHNEEYFPDSYSYTPERWIPGAAPGVTQESTALCQSAFTPFSIGPRGCVGKGMAYKELMMTFARLLWMYDLRLAPGTHAGEGDPSLRPETGRHRKQELQLQDRFISQFDGPIVQFQRA